VSNGGRPAESERDSSEGQRLLPAYKAGGHSEGEQDRRELRGLA